IDFDSCQPTITVVPVTPDPRHEPVSEVTFIASEPIVGFDLADLRLTRRTDDAVDVPLVDIPGVSLTSDDRQNFVLSGLESLTKNSGQYSIELIGVAAAIVDDDGNPLAPNLGGDWNWTMRPGDASEDCCFESSDLVRVFQKAKYEKRGPAKWSEGDWNLDGFFDSSDLVFAFQADSYERCENGPGDPLARLADQAIAALTDED
ncbi:MAG: hypothetical protein KDB27_13520, partial [Planctomycetales bacterium]|nr:hypothetical protein [Planctomycetales bacterium]